MVQEQGARGFWDQLIDVELSILACDRCQGDPDDVGSPQTSYVGREYRSGGVVFVLKQPGDTLIRRGETERDDRLDAVREGFRAQRTLDTYRVLADEMFGQMLGEMRGRDQRWPTWRRVVGKCVADCLSSDAITWTNVVRFRGHYRAADARHATDVHLRPELNALQPGLVVAIYGPAAEAIRRIGGPWPVEELPGKPRTIPNADCTRVQQRIADMGLCR